MAAKIKLNRPSKLQFSGNVEVNGDVWRYSRDGPVGVVKIMDPMSPLNNYYEIKILSKGRRSAIGIGMGTMGYSMSAMPGWNSQCVGYHADDAKLFHENGMGKNMGAPTCTDGDIMGCGALFDVEEGPAYVKVFFTKNGKLVGERVKMKRPLHGLYPIVGMHSLGESVEYLGHSVCTSLEGVDDDAMSIDNAPRDLWLRCNAVKFLRGGTVLEYFGNQQQGQDIGIAQSLYPLTKSSHYFEMKIENAGKDGCLAIGLGSNTYPLHRHPGWNPGGVGYHADNGQLYVERGQGVDFGPTCTTGDTMGCGLQFTDDEADFSSEESEDEDWEKKNLPPVNFYDDFYYGDNRQQNIFVFKNSSGSKKDNNHEVTVFFTKNGSKVGETKAKLPKGGFFPMVAMLSVGERVMVDFNALTG
ncbi:SPRY domain-containing protein 3-like [Dysidea avara]|uniref:SPRY domain-containing protein 3-like n=1 Tax=Dysidea avara TaxID=196820 RepID=UPI003329C5B8